MTTELVAQDYAVLPTPTEVVTLKVRDTRLLSGTVENLDGLQTVDGSFLVAVWPGQTPGASTLGDLAAIQPGEVRPFTVDCAMFDELTLSFTASGAGCDVRISARPDRGRR